MRKNESFQRRCAMGWISSKICGIVAAAMTLLSLLLEIVSLACTRLDATMQNEGKTISFDFWFYSILLAFVSLLFYAADAGISFVKALRREHSWFHGILTLVLLGGIPMLCFVGCSGGYVTGSIWCAYYVTMLVLEIVSIRMTRNYFLYGC